MVNLLSADDLTDVLIGHFPAQVGFDHGMVVLDFLRRTFRNLLTMIEHGDLLTGVHHHLEDVFYYHYRQLVFFFEGEDGVHQIVRLHRGKSGSRFIQKQ